mgnify:CR=1 FL=1
MPAPVLPTLFEAAGQRALIETTPRQSGLFANNGLLDNGARSLFSHWQTEGGPLYRYSFDSACFVPRLTLFGWQQRPLRDTLYTQPDTILQQFAAALHTTAAETCDRRAWAGFDHWSSNYYHWMAHTLPAIGHFLDKAHADDVFLLPRLSRWQKDCLDFVGLAPRQRMVVEPDRVYLFPRVIYTDFIRGRADFKTSQTARQSYARLRHHICPQPAPPHRLLFVERADAGNRHIPNESTLGAALATLGFERVRPETLPLHEQIRLFSEARMVTGFLGAGLANIAWCQPGTIVQELVPAHHQNPCFLALCLQNSLHYWGELVETGVATHDHTSPARLPVDVAAVVDNTRHLLRSLPGV